MESTAKIKKKIRDINRTLRKNQKLPATKKLDYERTLKALNVELNNSQTNLKAQKNSKKYHMVRFFEKKKAIRNLKRLKNELNDIDDKKLLKKHRKKIRHAEIDLCYVFLFPKTEKYISLFPNIKEEDKKDPNAEIGWKKTEKQRMEFRKEAEKMYDEDKLPFRIDDVLAGKNVKISHKTVVAEIDAPEEKVEEVDEFFS